LILKDFLLILNVMPRHSERGLLIKTTSRLLHGFSGEAEVKGNPNTVTGLL
jgi:hypothetical protein